MVEGAELVVQHVRPRRDDLVDVGILGHAEKVDVRPAILVAAGSGAGERSSFDAVVGAGQLEQSLANPCPFLRRERRHRAQ